MLDKIRAKFGTVKAFAVHLGVTRQAVYLALTTPDDKMVELKAKITKEVGP